ncbi:hypothetical protein Tco_0984476, partial [Tanacetum coccineum]
MVRILLAAERGCDRDENRFGKAVAKFGAEFLHQVLEQEEYSTRHIEISAFLRSSSKSIVSGVIYLSAYLLIVRQHWQVSMGFVVRRKGSTIDEERVKDFVTN